MLDEVLKGSYKKRLKKGKKKRKDRSQGKAIQRIQSWLGSLSGDHTASNY
jgi:hypothetical protein